MRKLNSGSKYYNIVRNLQCNLQYMHNVMHDSTCCNVHHNRHSILMYFFCKIRWRRNLIITGILIASMCKKGIICCSTPIDKKKFDAQSVSLVYKCY